MRRGRTRRVAANTSLSITSMMDMFVIILLFLLVFFDPEVLADDGLKLPDSVARTPVAVGTTLRITPAAVLVDGVEKQRLDAGAIPAGTPRDRGAVLSVAVGLAEARRALDPEPEHPTVLVECDETVPWSTLGDLLQSASAAGFEQYRFVVLGPQ